MKKLIIAVMFLMVCPVTVKADDLDLIAKVVQAEAGNQSFEGKRLVAAVVLNRVDSKDFPDTVKEVIYQKGQFRKDLDKFEPTEEDYAAAKAEMESRSNTEIIFFNCKGFTKYGKAWKKVGDHYFSTRK